MHADFLLYGHIFCTGSKPDQSPRGTAALAEVVKRSVVSVIAIGGIGLGQVEQVMATGVAGIAIMSGIIDAANPLQAAINYREALNRNGGSFI
ncbi:Regulatory protein TenI [compost metagenome]